MLQFSQRIFVPFDWKIIANVKIQAFRNHQSLLCKCTYLYFQVAMVATLIYRKQLSWQSLLNNQGSTSREIESQDWKLLLTQILYYSVVYLVCTMQSLQYERLALLLYFALENPYYYKYLLCTLVISLTYFWIPYDKTRYHSRIGSFTYASMTFTICQL